MRLTTFTDYSLRMCIYVAASPEGRATIAEVAKAFDISESHLVKVAHLLGKEGILVNTRGRGGGLRLARAAGAITVGSVVRAAEGADVPAECFSSQHNECVISGICRLGGVLAQALGRFYEVLDRHTIADLVSNRKQLATVLQFHRHPEAV